MRNLQEHFNDFHDAHPEVYTEFKKRVQQLWNKGQRHYSADGILHIIRFHSVVDGRPEDEFKINNNYAAFYARLWQAENPQRAAFFATRIQRSVSQPH